MRKKNIIDAAKVKAAMGELISWQGAQAEFLARVAAEEEFYRMRVCPKVHANTEGERFAPTSAWLFNTLVQKHADMMENIPTAACLAREPGDEPMADQLSHILPVVMERNRFEEIYSDNMWYKLKHGVCAYGVLWNNEIDNGLGDIEVCRVDLRRLFWQPHIRDLQQSRSVYYVDYVDSDTLRAMYPRFDNKKLEQTSGALLSAGDGDRIPVVDWYYKKRLPDGRTVLHYCKFAGEAVLFASENEEGYENGWYEHGQYPFVLDVLYPIEDEAVGFGFIAISRDPQLYIDRMDRNLLEYMDWATRVRFFCKNSTGVDAEQFTDLTCPIVQVEGEIDEERLRQITVEPLNDLWLELKRAKIDELKETTTNRNLLQGGADGGVVAASAITALQEAGNKTVRDMVAASYRAYVRIVHLVIECMRQFYRESRCFRIIGETGEREFITFSANGLSGGTTEEGALRHPVFDIDVRAEKKDPYSRFSHNETVKELYNMGVFKPENAEEAALLLSCMDFSGAGRLRAQLIARTREARARAVSAESGTAGANLHADPLGTALQISRAKVEEARG